MNTNKGYKLSEETKTKIKKNHAKYWLGKKMSEETKNKMSLSRKGKKHSDEWKEKIRKSLSGKVHNEYRKMKNSEGHKGKHISPKTEFKKGHIVLEKTRRKTSEALMGRHHSAEMRKKMSEARKGERGSNWQGGITSENGRIRRSIEMRLWREAVFARDNFTCQECGKRGGYLHAHHKKSFAKFPELRVSIENGITLCLDCHKKTENYAGFVH